jgi:hypothetical protein
MRNCRATWLASGVAVLALGVFTAPAAAQMMPMVPNGMTGQQLQSMMYMRALQGYGRGGVRSGYPQDIPLGNPSGGGNMPGYDDGTASRTSTSQQRADARKVREDQKRAAREEAKAKKAKVAKKPAKKDAHAAKKPKDEALGAAN